MQNGDTATQPTWVREKDPGLADEAWLGDPLIEAGDCVASPGGAVVGGGG